MPAITCIAKVVTSQVCTCLEQSPVHNWGRDSLYQVMPELLSIYLHWVPSIHIHLHTYSVPRHSGVWPLNLRWNFLRMQGEFQCNLTVEYCCIVSA